MEVKQRSSARVDIGGDRNDPHYRYKRDVIKLTHEQHHGAQTILVNIKSISKELKVPIAPLISFIQKGLACKIMNKEERYMVQTTLTIVQVEKLIQKFEIRFCLCPHCKNPEWNRKSCPACGHQVSKVKPRTTEAMDKEEESDEEVPEEKNKNVKLMHKMYDVREAIIKSGGDQLTAKLKKVNQFLDKAWRLEDSDTDKWKQLKKAFLKFQEDIVALQNV